MKLKRVGDVILRLLVLAAGFGLAYGILYAAGKLLVPLLVALKPK